MMTGTARLAVLVVLPMGRVLVVAGARVLLRVEGRAQPRRPTAAVPTRQAEGGLLGAGVAMEVGFLGRRRRRRMMLGVGPMELINIWGCCW